MMHGRRWVEWVAVGLAGFGQSGCTSLVPLDAKDGQLLAAIEAGDRLSVLDSRGVTTELVVTAVGEDFIEGMGERDHPVRIAAAEMREVHERNRAPGKTIGLGMGVGFLLFMGTVTMAGYEWYY
jgi:hypothetical protein